MYLRTPKRYSGRARRHNLISMRWAWLWLLTPLAALGAAFLVQNRDQVRPVIDEWFEGVVSEVGEQVQQINAPPPTATPDPGPNLQRAQSSWGRGEIQGAVALYAEAIPSLPNDIASHYNYTLGLIMMDRDEDALAAAENAVTANPFVADAWTIRAMAYNANDQPGPAIASAQRALELASEQRVAENPALARARARALAQLANAYYNLEQYTRALTTAEEALEVDPDSAEALYIRALVQWYDPGVLDWDGALADMQAAYSLEPNYIYIGVDMAYLESNRQTVAEQPNYDAAIEQIETILELNPDHARALYWMGTHYLRIVGDPTQAADYLSRCVRGNPAYALCHYQLGRAQYALENYTDAQASFDSAIQFANASDDLRAYYYWWASNTSLALLDQTQCATYLREGWPFAQQIGGTIVDDYGAQAGNCGAALSASPEITPEAQGGA
jgi:tetratricopeptide (TPR) repeat protein